MRQTVTKSISVSVCVCITVCLCVCIYVCLCVFISVCLYICGVLEVLTQTGAQKPLKAAGCIVRSLLTYLCLRSLLLCHRPHLCLLFVCAIAACHLEATKALWSVHTLHQRVYSTPSSVHQKVPAHHITSHLLYDQFTIRTRVSLAPKCASTPVCASHQCLVKHKVPDCLVKHRAGIASTPALWSALIFCASTAAYSKTPSCQSSLISLHQEKRS